MLELLLMTMMSVQESDGDPLAGLGSDDEDDFADADDEDEDGNVRDAGSSCT